MRFLARNRHRRFVTLVALATALIALLLPTGASAENWYGKIGSAYGADGNLPGNYSGIQQTRYDSIPSAIPGTGDGTGVCNPLFGAGGSQQIYQAQDVVLNNGYVAEMGTGHQCIPTVGGSGTEYWYAGYYDGSNNWHTEWYNYISGSNSHTFYFWANSCDSGSHCWNAQVDSTVEKSWDLNQSGSAIYNMLGTTYNDISTNTPVSTYQVSQMAYENGFVTSWHNFSSTIFHSNGNYMCVDSLSATKMNVAQNPPSFVTCS